MPAEKSKTATAAFEAGEQVAVSASATEFELPLQEFCIRLSTKDRRVELIGGFHATEKAAGRFKDTEAGFQSRFEAFVNKPV